MAPPVVVQARQGGGEVLGVRRFGGEGGVEGAFCCGTGFFDEFGVGGVGHVSRLSARGSDPRWTPLASPGRQRRRPSHGWQAIFGIHAPAPSRSGFR